MPILAEQARFQRFENRGSPVATPAANGFLELVRVSAPAGQYALVDLVQAVTLNPSTTVLNRILPGFTWTAYLADQSGNNKTQIGINGSSPSLEWTFPDSRPCVRNLQIVQGKTLIFGITVSDFTQIPATITHFAGGIVGTLWNADGITETELLGLWGRL